MEIASLTVSNLLRYFAQVLVVVAATELGLRLIRPAAPRVRLACWYLAIAVCVLLPFAPLRELPRAAGDAPTIALHLDDVASTTALAPMASLPALLLAGVIARAAWLGLGFVRLARLRTEGQRLDAGSDHAVGASALDCDVHALRAELAPRAEVRWHDTALQPITFGLRRPIILLPRRVAELPREAQRAILCHELLHVARRDWGWMLAEEALQTALWWHPAIWWALAQVHLQREEMIDAQVVAITGARQSYMRALIAFAETTPLTAPVVPFIRRRHLAARLAQLVQEVPMSRMRLTSAAAALSIIAGAGWTSLSAMPLQKSKLAARDAPTTADDKPVKASQVDRRPRVVNEVKPVYPKDALESRVEGEVEVEVRIAKDGSVADTRMVKSIPALDRAAMDAVRQWTFEPSTIKGKPVEVLCNITVRFRLK